MAENQDSFADDPKVGDEELKGVNLFQDVDPATATPEQVAAIVKTGKTLLVQKKQWRERAIDPATGKPFKELLADAQAKPDIKPNPPNPAEPTTPETEGRLKRLELSEDKRQFGHAKELTPEETDHVFAFAQGTGLKPSEALEHPFVKSGLESLRRARKADGATPGPSSRSPVVEGKTFSEMNTDEKRKNFEKVVGAIGQSRKR